MASIARRKDGRRILPFRLPIFRIFYSITYTILYLLLLVILAITPIAMIYGAIQSQAYQYIFMVGGTYVLTFVLAVFIYSSRIYTNRSVLAAVGKAYVPIEDDEVSKKVRKMIVKQLERSAVVAWESRPRDIEGEILAAESDGLLPPDTISINHNDYTVGEIVTVDPSHPPWGHIQHLGWSSPSSRDDNKNPNVQFAKVIAELPHLIEARAVSLAPPDPLIMSAGTGSTDADPLVVDILRRPRNRALREYLTQISYLGLIQPPQVGQRFLSKYERARFSGRPISEKDFDSLMQTFADLLSGMTSLSPAIIDEIHKQTGDDAFEQGSKLISPLTPHKEDKQILQTPSPLQRTPVSSMGSPVTAYESRSRNATPYFQPSISSQESFGSVIQRPRNDIDGEYFEMQSLDPNMQRRMSPSISSLSSDAGSVIRHNRVDNGG